MGSQEEQQDQFYFVYDEKNKLVNSANKEDNEQE
jgi:hypothetical protein